MNPLLFCGIIIILFTVVFSLSWIYNYIERVGSSYASKKLLLMGRGVPRRFIRIQLIIVEFSILSITILAAYLLLLAPRLGFNPLIAASITIFSAVLMISLNMVRIRVSVVASARKTSVEVELPFLLSLMWTLSETHLTLYDLFTLIEKSAALKAWAREVKLAKKIASAMNISLVHALTLISETHPSKTVRDVFKRVVTVGHISGTIREVVKRSFRYIYDHLQARLLRLAEKLDIVNGAIMFGFMFVPIMFATVSPIMGQTPIDVFVISMIVECTVTLLMYAFLGHIYPSGFIIATPRPLLALAAASTAFSVALIWLFVQPVLTAALQPTYRFMGVIEPGLSEHLLLFLIIVALLPTVLYSEVWFRRAMAYTRLMKIATDSAEVSSSLGMNFVTVFEDAAMREGGRVYKIARSIIEGYRSELFRRAIVIRAPSIFHASFIETLLNALLVGVPANVLKALTRSYDSLIGIFERISGISRTLEGMIVSLSAMLGFFTKYLENIFANFSRMIAEAARGAPRVSFPLMFSFDANVFVTVSAVTLLSILLVSFFTGKTRGGSLIYGFRTALLSVLIYAVMRVAAGSFMPAF